jgi:hypothetical protein
LTDLLSAITLNAIKHPPFQDIIPYLTVAQTKASG